MQSQQKKILIVEDEPRLVEVLRDKLKDEGFAVVIARDGEQGLAMALSELPDLILLDILLPKMEGLDMLKELRAQQPDEATKVIVLSNLSDTNRVNKALASGAPNFLVKSNWDLDDIVREIKSALV